MGRMRRKLLILLCLAQLYVMVPPDTAMPVTYPIVQGAYTEDRDEQPAVDGKLVPPAIVNLPMEPGKAEACGAPAELPGQGEQPGEATPEAKASQEASKTLMPEAEGAENFLETAPPLDEAELLEAEAPQEAAETVMPEPGEAEDFLEAAPPLDEAEPPESIQPNEYTGGISGSLWIDEDLNGTYDAGESPAANYPVRLYWADDLTLAIQSTATDFSGRYSFENLSPGIYVVGFGFETVGGQQYVLFFGGRKGDNHFELAPGWEIAEDLADIKTISAGIAVEANSVVTGIDGCLSLPLTPAPVALSYSFETYMMIVDEKGIPVEGISWVVTRLTGTIDSPVYTPYRSGKTSDNGKILESLYSNTSGSTYNGGYIDITIPSGVQTAHLLGTVEYKNSTQSNTTVVDYNNTVSIVGGKISFGVQEYNGEGTAIYKMGNPFIVMLNGYVPPPDVTTGQASNITPTTAVIQGDYDLRSGNAVVAGCYFLYGAAPNLSGATRIPWTPAGNEGTVSALLEGLTPDTVYYYQICAQNTIGFKAGAIESFRTSHNVNVSFDLQDGSPVQTLTYNSADALNALSSWAAYENPGRSKYIFAGWYTNAEGDGTQITGDTIVGDIFSAEGGTLYAKWEPQPYELAVFHELRDGSDLPGVANYINMIPHGTLVTPSVPTPAGFMFVGWTLNGEKHTGAYPSFTMPARLSDLHLIYGYDGDEDGAEDFLITKEYKTPSGDVLREAEGVYLEAGETFSDPAVSISGCVYDHYEVGGIPSAQGATPSIGITESGGSFTITYIYKRSITVSPVPANIIYGEDDPDPAQWQILVEGHAGVPALVYGSDYTLSVAADPLGFLHRSAGFYGVTMTPTALMQDKLQDYLVTVGEGFLFVGKRPVKFTAMTVHKVFDGAVYGQHTFALPYEVPPVSVDSLELPGGHYVHSATLRNEEHIDSGEYSQAMEFIDIVIRDLEENDVTSNYIPELCPGHLTISIQNVMLTADSQSKVYGDEDPELSATVQYAVDTYDMYPEYTLSREPGEDVGIYMIHVNPVPSPNYVFVEEEGLFEIIPKGNGDHPPGEGDAEHFYGTIIIDPQTKSVGEEDPILTFTAEFEGLVGDDELSFQLVREEGEEIGEYTIAVEWEDSYPTKNYDVTAVLIIEDTLTILGTLDWGSLDPGMTGMEFDFGQQRTPMGAIFYRSLAETHTLRIADNRETPKGWQVDVGLTRFEGDDGSSFAGTIALANPSCAYSGSGLTAEEALAIASGESPVRLLIAEDGLGNGVFDIVWSGKDVTLHIDAAETGAIHQTTYSAQLVWSIRDAP